MPTLEEALAYLGYDYADEVIQRNVSRALSTARAALRGAVGEDVEELLPNDEEAKELVLIYLDDIHSNRGVSAKTAAVTRRMVNDMEWHLRLKLRRAREAAAGGEEA